MKTLEIWLDVLIITNLFLFFFGLIVLVVYLIGKEGELK